MKKLFLLLALFGVLAVGCEELFPTEQSPNATPVFSTDGESSYIVDAEGEEIIVMVTTNIDYSVVIPEDAEEWLSVADTRAVIREETLTFIVAENKAYDRRSTTVTLVDNEGNVLQAIEFIQRAAAMPQSACPSDEIWYTNDSTTEPTKPYKTDVFGANIVSNTYSEDSERWVIKFDGDVTTIGDYAFDDCGRLKSVTIPDSVTTIGECAFRGCSSLTSVTIPDSVTTIGDYAFCWCSSLQEFRGKFASKDGRCLIIDGTLNAFAPAGLTEYTIPNSVTTIGNSTFANCSSLTSVTIPDSVTVIGVSAFYSCSSLISITIPDSVTVIGDSAFIDCNSLTSVTIPDSVTTIETWAFAWCDSLTSVTIPDSVTTIGSHAFYGCSSLTSITIPDSVTTIGECAFWGCGSLTSVTISDSVTTIGESAFWGCGSLTSVYCKATTPPAGRSDMFALNASGRKIYVPMESVNKYKSASYWSEYADAIEGYNF